MDQTILVGDRIDDGQKLLTELVRSGFDVEVAFWLLPLEEESWLLYVGSNSVDPERIGDAYGMLYVCLARIADVAVSLSDVKLVRPSNPAAKDAIAVRDRNPAGIAVRYHGKRLGDLPIQEVYIYPRLGPMSRDEVIQTVMAVIKRGGPIRPLIVTFADGTAKRALPVGIQLYMDGPNPGLHIELLDPKTQERQAVAADKVVNLRETG